MFSFKGIPIKIFALLMALVALVGGVYLTFFHSSGYVRTRAVIVDMEEKLDGADEPTQVPIVEYLVGEETYTGRLDVSGSGYDIGKTVNVLYDPKNPSVVHGGGGFGIYMMGIGVLILAVIVVAEVRKKKALSEVKAAQRDGGSVGYTASVPGPERRLYFLTDLGTAKAGHRIEDAQRNVLFEAKMTRFTMTGPLGFDFIDHEHGKTTPHLVGHEEESDWGGSLLLDNHFTFDFDGEDIWKHLKRNGIAVESRLTGAVRTEYRILRDGVRIATAVSSSRNVHEEDEAARSKLASLVPVKGFYRIDTTETNLSLLFVTLLAFARSGASDDRGGNFKTLVNTVKGN